MKIALSLLSIFCWGSFSYGAEMPDIFGGLRYRYERIDKEGSDVRNRQRIKASMGIKSNLGENLKYTFSLISGSTDPVSGNQTLDGGLGSKSVSIDRAEFNYKLPLQFSIGGGKMKNPFYRPGNTELIWDGDLRPEGLRLAHKFKKNAWSVHTKYAHYELEERSTESNTMMDGFQAVGAYKSNDFKLKFGGSIYEYSYIKDRSPLYDSTNSFGNELTSGGNYANGFTLQELFFVAKMTVSSFPVSIFFDYIKNDDANSDNKGSLYGFSFGKAKKAGTWKLHYNFRKLEQNAVVGAFTDSDFKGGGTDGKGHEMGFKYGLTDAAKLGLAHFINETSVKVKANSKDYHRTQLDFSLKF